MKIGDYVTNEDGKTQGRVLFVFSDGKLEIGNVYKDEKIGKAIKDTWGNATAYTFQTLQVDGTKFRKMEVPE